MTRAGEKKVGRGMEGTSIMCHLPAKLVGEKILTRVPITSLKSVRSTCKLWDSLTKNWILGKAEQFFLGFMTKDSKVCSVRYHLSRSKDKEDEDLLDLSVKQVDLLDHIKISRVFYCTGLLLCVTVDNSRLLIWNPYLGQTQWIECSSDFHTDDCFALGYDIDHNHKVLRFLNYGVPPELVRYEIYDLSSNSWRVLNVTLTPRWEIVPYCGGVSLKGNTYFYAHESIVSETHENGSGTIIYGNFLLCFDFTTERFGPRLPLPVNNDRDDIVTLSCAGEEKLALLYNIPAGCCDRVEIWVTTTLESNHVSWSRFFCVEMKPFALTRMLINTDDVYYSRSFFIDEEEKVAVVFDLDLDGPLLKETGAVCDQHHHTAFVIGEDGYFRSVSLGVAHHFMESLTCCKDTPETRYCTPLVSSPSYLPSLVQLNQPHKGEE